MTRFRAGYGSAIAAAALAVLMISSPVLAAQGDLTFSRLGGFQTYTRWEGVAVQGSAVYVAGERRRKDGSGIGLLRRYDRSGAVIWTRTVLGPDGQSTQINGVAVDSSGVYVTGFYFGRKRHIAFVARYQPNATRLWLEPIVWGGRSAGLAITTFGASIYVTGVSAEQGMFIRKYTRDAVTEWIRFIPDDAGGYLQRVFSYGVAAAADAVYVVGEGTVSGPGGVAQVVSFIRAYDHDGNQSWSDARLIADSTRAFSVAADSSGAYVVALAYTHEGGDDSVYGSFLLKYTDEGFRWQRRITARSSTEASGVALAPSGVWIAGTAYGRLTNQPGTSSDPNGDAFVVRYSRSGTPLLTYQYSEPGAQSAYSLDADDQGVYAAGMATGFGGQDAIGVWDGLLLGIEVP